MIGSAGTMEEQVQTILEMATTGALSLLAMTVSGLLAWGARSIKHWLDSQAHMASFACASTKLASLASDAVLEVEQTLVKQLKNDEAWNADTAKTARDTAAAIVKRHLGTRGLAELRGCLGLALADIEGLIRTQIEVSVQRAGTAGRHSPTVALGE
ncbi:MAG: hypothetical protein COA94_09130 [Rickettsiales bacterium]|nr:MAG: hypothetical protein COA94_09130 [Rickettsiales bacterium]